jgi:CelD/BcsL family acetyltransferase involved in cellulose biosynthesis/SAM-dependent methyltransferase
MERSQMTAATDVGGAAPELSVDEVTTYDALEGLREEWHELLDRCPWATPFQSPEWLLSWWCAIGGGELCVTTLRRGGRLVGLAPLFIYCGPDGRRRLAMLGAGISDYEDVLLEPELADAGALLLLQHIAKERSRWHAGEFFELRAASPLLGAPWPRELSVDRYPSSSCTVLSLPTTVDALPASLSWRFRRRLRNARNRLGRAGDAQFVTADERSLPELLEALVRLHSLRWEERGEAGVLSDPRVRRFHEAAAAGLLRRGWLRLHALRLGSAPVAVLYGFAHRDRVCMYLSGLDPSADFCSPGVLILQHAIEQAIQEGAREFDMLRGTESYKYDWSAESRPNAGLRLRHATVAGDMPCRYTVEPDRTCPPDDLTTIALLRATIAGYLSGEMSAPVALARLLVASGDAAAVHDAVESLPAAASRPDGNGAADERLRELRALLPEIGAGCARIGQVLREELERPSTPARPDQVIARTRRLFDRFVAESEEASVALYSLGSPALLAAASEELVRVLQQWDVARPGRAVLDVGCGIGRIAARLAPLVGCVWGIDISPGMIAAARRRCAGLPNVHFAVCDGVDLSMRGDGSVDVVLAVDSFPYVVEAGEASVALYFREAHRVLRDGGDFVLVNFSYRGDVAADRADVLRLARAAGFDVLVSGCAPFALWDGVAFHLAREATGNR